jgi:hypothetical protein
MLARGLLPAFLLAGGISAGCRPEGAPAAAEPCGPSTSAWRFVFANDGHGKDLQGSREALLAAIRKGSPVRVGWSESSSSESWSVEEFSDAGFTNIMGGRDVVAQLDPALIQTNYVDATKAGLRSPALEWHALMSTDGRFEAVMVDRETGKTARRLVQRTRMNWYVFAPPPDCDRREAILPPADARNEQVEDSRTPSPGPTR